MTDNEIIKALECCIDEEKGCEECPFEQLECITLEENKILKVALDLINRQKAEIERLQGQIESLNKAFPCVVSVGNNCMVYARSLEDYDNLIGDISTEGIKEFCVRIERVLSMHPAQRRYYEEIKREFIKENANEQ